MVMQRLSTQGFAPENSWVWDTWFIEEGADTHAFFLTTHKLKSYATRDWEGVAIGHAISRDLVHWTHLGDAITPGEPGEWDDMALWSGCALKHHNKYLMYYTGRGRKNPETQRIGVAVSDDLITWEKPAHNMVLEADGIHYDNTFTRDESGVLGIFRDPFVFAREDGTLEMVFSARTGGPFSACLGRATSTDGMKWELREPFVAPNTYSEMETPQLIEHDGLWYLLFSTHTHTASPGLQKDVGTHSGLHGYYAPSLDGPWKKVNRNGVILDNGKSLYMVRLMHRTQDTYKAMGWLNLDAKEMFVGKLCKPFAVTIQDGSICANIDTLREHEFM